MGNKRKYFHVLSDGRTVRKIDEKTYHEYSRKYPRRRLVRVAYGYFALQYAGSYAYIDVRQLQQIVEACKE